MSYTRIIRLEPLSSFNFPNCSTMNVEQGEFFSKEQFLWSEMIFNFDKLPFIFKFPFSLRFSKYNLISNKIYCYVSVALELNSTRSTLYCLERPKNLLLFMIECDFEWFKCVHLRFIYLPLRWPLEVFLIKERQSVKKTTLKGVN